jgi:hypothetical protein
MPPLEELFRLEIAFHRLLRTRARGTADATALHTAYALQAGYERLIRAAGRVTADDIERIRQRHALAADLRDLLAARDSLRQLLGIPRFDGWRIATTASSAGRGKIPCPSQSQPSRPVVAGRRPH